MFAGAPVIAPSIAAAVCPRLSPISPSHCCTADAAIFTPSTLRRSLTCSRSPPLSPAKGTYAGGGRPSCAAMWSHSRGSSLYATGSERWKTL